MTSNAVMLSQTAFRAVKFVTEATIACMAAMNRIAVSYLLITYNLRFHDMPTLTI